MGAGASVSESPVPLLVSSPCPWLKHVAGKAGISLNTKGKEYKVKGKGFQGRGRGVAFGSAVEATNFVADGSLHSLAVRVANDPDLSLEINHRKLEVGATLSVWYNIGHPEWACRWTINADSSLSPLGKNGKPLKHLAVGIKKGSGEAILVRNNDVTQKVIFAFGGNMASLQSDISAAKKLAETQMKELQNFPMLLLSPACESVGNGMKALYLEQHEWKNKGKNGNMQRGRMVSIGAENSGDIYYTPLDPCIYSLL